MTIQLDLADARQWITTVPDQSVDCILVDPPYNLAMYSTGNIKANWHKEFNNNIAKWDAEDFHPQEWLLDFVRILKPTGNLFAYATYNHVGKWHEHTATGPGLHQLLKSIILEEYQGKRFIPHEGQVLALYLRWLQKITMHGKQNQHYSDLATAPRIEVTYDD